MGQAIKHVTTPTNPLQAAAKVSNFRVISPEPTDSQAGVDFNPSDALQPTPELLEELSRKSAEFESATPEQILQCQLSGFYFESRFCCDDLSRSIRCWYRINDLQSWESSKFGF